jgi:hypothetical protein
MHEDFTGNTLGTAKALELTSSLQTFTGSVSPLDTNDYYGFNLSNRSSFNMTLSGLGANADVELLNSGGEVLQTSAQLGTSSESLFTSLDAGSYYIKVYSGAETTTDYNLNLSATPSQDVTSLQNRDSLTGFDNPSFDTGVFTVGSSGQVSIDYLFDGGLYQGELAIFSLEGMEQYQTDLNEFIAEAARRALSDSQLGHVVISDSTQGARFHSSLLEEPDYNSGDYLGVNTFSMRPGDTFGVMLVPNGTVQEVFGNPAADGAARPLFSLSTSNPNDAFHLGQIADATGNGDTFIFEDLRVDTGSDYDYNDIIFRVRGATGEAILLDDVIDPAKDWRDSDLGRELLAYADASLNFDSPQSNQPLVGIIDTGFNANNPDIDYSRMILGRDRIDGDNNPLLQTGEGNEHGTHVLGIIGATRGNGLGIDGINDQAPIWLGRAVGSGEWAGSLVEFVDTAKVSGQPNAVVNLSFDLTQINPDGSVTTRYELTPQERQALEYARQNNVLIVAAAGNDGGTMSALGQASQEFDNIITVGSIDYNGNRADYSSYGNGLDLVAYGGTHDEPAISTVSNATDLDLVTGKLDTSEDEMAVLARTTFEEVFGFSSEVETSNTDALELPENLTSEERQAYEEAIQKIDTLLLDYLDAASAKIALELLDKQFATGINATERFLDTFNGDLADTLIEAQKILGDDAASTEPSISTEPDFLVPLDLGVGEMAGTSVAAAKVTGAVSQVWAANPGLSFAQVKEILKKTAVDLNTPSWDLATGAGLVAIAAAVELAKRTQPELYQPKPLLSPLTWSGAGKVTPGERAASTVSVPTFTGRIMNAGYVTTQGFLRIRSGSGQNYAAVGRKSPGDAVDFDAYDDNGSFVQDPSMPGGGSSRWYRIAGTNTWMSALYIDNTPERAEEERRRQEEIRRAEEEARRVEEEARRAEEEARRAEEELRRLEEEERRRQEQLQALITEVSQKVGDLGELLRSYVSNGVTVYEFAKGILDVQPDGRYGFYEKVAEVSSSEEFEKIVNQIKDEIKNQIKDNYENIDPKKIDELARTLAYKAYSPGQTGFVLPRFDNMLYAGTVTKGATVAKFLQDLDNKAAYIAYKAPVKNGPNTGFVLPRFGSTAYARSAKGFRPLGIVIGGLWTAGEVALEKDPSKRGEKAIKGGFEVVGGAIGAAVGSLIPVPFVGTTIGGMMGSTIGGRIGEIVLETDPIKKREKAVKGGFEATGVMIGGIIGAALGGGVPGAIVGGVAGSIVGGWAGDRVNENWDGIMAAKDAVGKAINDAGNAVSSLTSDTINALREQAKGAAERARALAEQARVKVEQAKATVQKAQAAYQSFKTEVQKATTQIVNKVIETGKQAYETVKNFVVDTYEQGKQAVTQAVTTAVNTVSNVVSGGANMVKSFFGW